MIIKKLLCFVVFSSTVMFSTYAHADHLSREIFVSNAWVQAMPPSQKITAAYMTIINNSHEEVTLVSASSIFAKFTEIHKMTEGRMMMQMAMVPRIHIPAQSKLILQPNGYHLMLINLSKPANKGDIFPIMLHFRDGTNVMVKASVQSQQPNNSSSMPGMKM